jgi:hypothetical protein
MLALWLPGVARCPSVSAGLALKGAAPSFPGGLLGGNILSVPGACWAKAEEVIRTATAAAVRNFMVVLRVRIYEWHANPIMD